MKTILINENEKHFHYKGDENRVSPSRNHPGYASLAQSIERSKAQIEKNRATIERGRGK